MLKTFKRCRVYCDLLVGFFFLSCSRGPDCDVVKETNIPSPDEQYVATVFEVTCYDTTGTTPHAHLRRAGEKRGDRGNLLVGAPLDSLRVSWIATNKLLVEYEMDHDPKLPASTNVDGVAVIYGRFFDDAGTGQTNGIKLK